MAFREFTDESGRMWTVWDVHPALVERRQRNTGPPPGVRERRHQDRRRAIISSAMAEGWLAFESRDGEHRRLAPIPENPGGWRTATEEQLRSWCVLARPARRTRRLIE